MRRSIWDGTGEMPHDAVHFSTHNGTLQGRPYVRARVRRYLASRWSRTVSPQVREHTLRVTVDSDTWLAQRNQQLVAAVCRDAEQVMLALHTETF